MIHLKDGGEKTLDFKSSKNTWEKGFQPRGRFTLTQQGARIHREGRAKTPPNQITTTERLKGGEAPTRRKQHYSKTRPRGAPQRETIDDTQMGSEREAERSPGRRSPETRIGGRRGYLDRSPSHGGGRGRGRKSNPTDRSGRGRRFQRFPTRFGWGKRV